MGKALCVMLSFFCQTWSHMEKSGFLEKVLWVKTVIVLSNLEPRGDVGLSGKVVLGDTYRCVIRYGATGRSCLGS